MFSLSVAFLYSNILRNKAQLKTALHQNAFHRTYLNRFGLHFKWSIKKRVSSENHFISKLKEEL